MCFIYMGCTSTASKHQVSEFKQCKEFVLWFFFFGASTEPSDFMDSVLLFYWRRTLHIVCIFSSSTTMLKVIQSPSRFYKRTCTCIFIYMYMFSLSEAKREISNVMSWQMPNDQFSSTSKYYSTMYSLAMCLGGGRGGVAERLH